jgi:hypothetical protein
MAIDRGLVRVAAVAIAGLVLVIGLVAALGGFRPALAGGRTVAAGETVRLQRWTLAIERAAFVDTSPSGLEVDPTVRVWLRITNTTDRTLSGLPERLVAVSADGVEYAAGREAWGQPRSAVFDPEVTAALAYDFAAPGGSIPATVAVVLRDETERKNFVISDNWRATTPAATVRLPCPDERQRR